MVREANLHLTHDRPAKAIIAQRKAIEFASSIYRDNDPHLTGLKKTLEQMERGAGLRESQRRAGFLYTRGRFAEAIPLITKEAEIRRKVQGQAHPDYALVLNELAVLYLSTGQFARAEPLCRQTMEIQKRVLGETHPDFASSVNNLAVLYRDWGNETRAEPLFRRTIEIRKKIHGTDHPDYAQSLENLASLYCEMGDYLRAEPLMRQALEIRLRVQGKEHPDVAGSLCNLAIVYQAQGDLSRAEPLVRQALDLRKAAYRTSHPDQAKTLGQLADVMRARGNLEQAEATYREAISLFAQTPGNGDLASLNTDFHLADLYFDQGDLANAERLYRHVLEVRTKELGKSHFSCAAPLRKLAALNAARKNSQLAQSQLRESLGIVEDHIAKVTSIQSERQQLVLAAMLRDTLDAYLSFGSGDPDFVSNSYRHVLGWKGAVFSRQVANRASRRSPQLAALFEELQSLSGRLAILSNRAVSAEGREAWQQEIADLLDREETLQQEISTHPSANAAQFLSLDRTLDDLRAKLPPESALVDLFEYTRSALPMPGHPTPAGERRMMAFIVRKGVDVVVIDLGAASKIDEAVDRWRRDYGRANSAAAKPGTDLHALVWKPLEPHLHQVETIYFSPDGGLCRFPIGALPGSRNAQYLIEERAIVTVPVPRLLPRLLEAAGTDLHEPKPEVLLIGNVDYGGSTGTTNWTASADGITSGLSRSAARRPGKDKLVFEALPGAAREIDSIDQLYQRQFGGKVATVLAGSRATEDAFRRGAPNHRWIHIATHGFFAPETTSSFFRRGALDESRPAGLATEGGDFLRGLHPDLLSGIALAGANHETASLAGASEAANLDVDDGILTALEVESLDLSNVELVVLSACETGLGKAAGGEGLLGLQRAFQLAGARNVIASLWKVDDQATEALMRLFYEKLWIEKRNPGQALREAQLSILRHPDQIPFLATTRGVDFAQAVKIVEGPRKSEGTQTTDPQFWAGFVIAGAGR